MKDKYITGMQSANVILAAMKAKLPAKEKLDTSSNAYRIAEYISDMTQGQKAAATVAEVNQALEHFGLALLTTQELDRLDDLSRGDW